MSEKHIPSPPNKKHIEKTKKNISFRLPPHTVQPERGEGLVEVHLEPCALLRQGRGLLRVAHGGAHEQGVVAAGAEAGGLPGKNCQKLKKTLYKSFFINYQSFSSFKPI